MIRLRTTIILFIVCIAAAFSAVGQSLLLKNLSNSIRLPAFETYNVTQDSRGYIWISTEYGLCRYNGHSLRTFAAAEGLPEGGVYCVREQADGTLWIATAANRILYVRNDKLHEAAFSKAYRAHLAARAITYQLAFTKNGRLIAMSNDKTISIDTATGTITDLQLSSSAKHDIELRWNEGEELIRLRQEEMRGKWLIKESQSNYVSSGKGPGKIIPIDPSTRDIDLIVRTCMSGKFGFFAIGNILYRVDKNLNTVKMSMPRKILSITMDKQDRLWVGLHLKGVYHFNDPGILSDYSVNLEGCSVSGVCEDNERGIWFTTLEKGVFYCRDERIRYYEPRTSNARPPLLVKVGNAIGCLHRDGELQVFDPRGGVKRKYQLAKSDIEGLVPQPDGWIAYGRSGIFKTDNAFRTSYIATKSAVPHFNYMTSMVVMPGGRVFGSSYSVIIELNEQHLETKLKMNFLKFVSKLDSTHILAVSSKDSAIQIVDVNSWQTVPVKGLSAPVFHTLNTQNGRTWLQTRNDGIYELQGDRAIAIDSIFRLRGCLMYKIVEDRYGQLWAATSNGLIKFVHQNGQWTRTSMTTLNGLPSNWVMNVEVDSNRVYVATLDGVCSLPLNYRLSDAPPTPILNSIAMDRTTINPSSTNQVIIPYKAQSVQLHFDVLSFAQEQQSLVYKLGNEGSTTTVIGTEISFPHLEPGEYPLTVSAINPDGQISATPYTCLLVVDRPFWMQSWFRLIIVLVFLSVVTMIVYLIIGIIKRRATKTTEINTLIASYQLSALQAQMNPHFIFNAINSIQNFILRKDELAAYDYLSKFGKLVRMVLNHSQLQTVALDQELQMIELYVDLERVRLDNNFDFHLHVSKPLETIDIEVPVMLIQPYIENAIWHGIMNKNDGERGRLDVQISKAGENLKVVIKDNGVGRGKAREFRKDTVHRSFALRSTEERLRIINELLQTNSLRVEVNDIVDNNGAVCGTSVIILLPLKFDN